MHAWSVCECEGGGGMRRLRTAAVAKQSNNIVLVNVGNNRCLHVAEGPDGSRTDSLAVDSKHIIAHKGNS